MPLEETPRSLAAAAVRACPPGARPAPRTPARSPAAPCKANPGSKDFVCRRQINVCSPFGPLRRFPSRSFSETAAEEGPDTCDRPSSLFCFLSSPTSSSGRIFTKPRGTAGSSVLPVLYETLKSPKPSRNKSLNLFRLLIFFFFKSSPACFGFCTALFCQHLGHIWCVLPHRFFFSHCPSFPEGSAGSLGGLRRWGCGCRGRLASGPLLRAWAHRLRRQDPHTPQALS